MSKWITLSMKGDKFSFTGKVSFAQAGRLIMTLARLSKNDFAPKQPPKRDSRGKFIKEPTHE